MPSAAESGEGAPAERGGGRGDRPQRPLPADAVFIGEVGLGGEVRPVSQVERRIAEAANMGMTRVYLAERGVPKRVSATHDVQVIGVRNIADLFQRLFT